jgi:hypothetical protein
MIQSERPSSTLNHLARRELEAGEELLWSASPIPTAHALRAKPYAIAGIGTFLLAAFWMWTAFGDSWIGFVPSAFLLLIGVGLLYAPVWLMQRARRTIYAVTDRRVLLIEQGQRDRITSFVPNLLKEKERKAHADGSGDILYSAPGGFYGKTKERRTVEFWLIGIPSLAELDRALEVFKRR